MSFANAAPDDADADIFSAVLTPHRSLNRRGFAIVIGALVALSLAVGATFFRLGAWPVPGFLGFDVLAVYLAFRLSYRAGRQSEEITVRRDRLTVRRVAVNGHAWATDLNPYWVRLEVDRRPPLGITRLAIVSHGRSLAVGAFLGPGEREELASALSLALAEAKAGATP